MGDLIGICPPLAQGSSRQRLDLGFDLPGLCPLRHLEVIHLLQIEPRLRIAAKEARQAQRRVGGPAAQRAATGIITARPPSLKYASVKFATYFIAVYTIGTAAAGQFLMNSTWRKSAVTSTGI